MKKILKILSIINFIGINTISLVACDKLRYTKKELLDLKEKNNIITKDGILEWISPQEKPFNQVDNKWYFVIWRGNKNDKWNITKFKNYEKNMPTIKKQNIFKCIDEKNKNAIKLHYFGNLYAGKIINTNVDLIVYEHLNYTNWPWRIDNKNYFKSVYRWNNNNEPKINIENIFFKNAIY